MSEVPLAGGRSGVLRGERGQSQPEQTLEFTLALLLPAAKGLSRKALYDYPFIHSIAESEKEGAIWAKTRLSIFSFGEEMTIKAGCVGPESALVKLSSVPLIKFTAIDYGKNYKNVKAVCSRLKSLGAEPVERSDKSGDKN